MAVAGAALVVVALAVGRCYVAEERLRAVCADLRVLVPELDPRLDRCSLSYGDDPDYR